MLSKCREAIRKYWNDKNGTTLVELMVTFALIGLFMTAATSMLTSSLQMFGRMQTTTSAVNVSDLILDKIAGEIAAADIPEADSTNGYYFWLEPAAKSRWVVFRNRSQSPIAIFAGESGSASQADMGKGQLFIKYYAVSKEGLKAVKEIDWHFDENVYMGYKITDLHFVQENKDAHPNVVTIYLTIRNDRTGFEYSSRRYAECYNYDGMYISERDDGQTNFPVDKNDGLTGAVEFEIKKTPGGGGEEPEDPLPAGWVQLTVYHKVIEYEGVHSNEILKTEVIRKEFDKWNQWIEASPMYPDELESYTYDKGYQQVPVSLENPYVEFTFYYTPKSNAPYCFVAYDQETGQEIKTGETKYGTHGQIVTVLAEDIEGYSVSSKPDITRPLVWTNTYQSYIKGGPNEFKFYYKKITDNSAPFPPRGPISEIEIKPVEKGYTELVRKIAEAFSDFFLNGWPPILTVGKDEIGYRTFTGEDGKEYAIAGFCELEGNHSAIKYSKEIAAAAKVDKKNIIYLTDDGFKNAHEMELLWRSLISQMDNLTQEEKNLLLSCDPKEMKLDFEEVQNENGESQFVVEELSFKFPDGTEAEAEYKKSK